MKIVQNCELMFQKILQITIMYNQIFDNQPDWMIHCVACLVQESVDKEATNGLKAKSIVE